MNRIVLFLATNIAIILVFSIVLQLFGVDRLLEEQGANRYRVAAYRHAADTLIFTCSSLWDNLPSLNMMVISKTQFL